MVRELQEVQLAPAAEGRSLVTCTRRTCVNIHTHIMTNNKVAPAADKGGVYVLSTELPKTKTEFTSGQSKKASSENDTTDTPWYIAAVPTVLHYIVLFILGILIWGWLWLCWSEEWRWNGPCFRLGSVVVAAWASGLAFNSLTTLPPLVAALLVGVFARNLGYLDMRDYTEIDAFLRKIYPVIILGKGSLGWDTRYMRANWRQVAALGAVPWAAEVAALAACTHLLLGHPWLWGLVLGTFYASVTFPVVMANVVGAGSSPHRRHNWPQLVATAGGTDTALSVGLYGAAFSFLFADPHLSDYYRYFRAFSAVLVGVVAGVAWGSLAGLLPHTQDLYLVELRVLFVLVGGIFVSFFTSYVGWGGVAGVAVLACNATAARHWARTGWQLNCNPAAAAYRAMWAACEPAVFAYTGTFVVLNSSIVKTVLYGFAVLAVCLTVRLSAAALVCRRMTLRERVFMCCVWSTKSIVEAVLCPTVVNILLQRGGTPQELRYADDIVILTVQEILVTTPLAFLLTRHLGPKLLKDEAQLEGESRA